MSYTLYNHDGTGSFAVEAALVMADADYTKINVDMGVGAQNDAAYAAVNPMMQIPTLILPGGEVLTESAAIVIHLADVFAGKGLAPAPGTPDHAQFLRWMVFISANLYEGDLRYFYAERYTTDVSPAGTDGVKAAADAHLKASCLVMEDHLDRNGLWLAGPVMTMVDVYFTMVRSWLPDMAAPAATPKLAALAKAVRADPQIGDLLIQHGL